MKDVRFCKITNQPKNLSAASKMTIYYLKSLPLNLWNKANLIMVYFNVFLNSVSKYFNENLACIYP